MAVLSELDRARRVPPVVSCAHCNLPVPAARLMADAAEQFCCAGCEAVWKLLHECQLEEYYRLRNAYEEQPSAPARISGKRFEYLDDPDYLQRFGEALTAGGYRVRLYLEGVHCIACAWLVEKVLLERERARFARLDIGKSVLEVVFNPAEVKLSALARALDRLGYTPHPLTENAGSAGQRKETRRLLARLGIAAASWMNIMLLAVSQYAGDFTGIEAGYTALFRWVSLGLALPAVVYSAWPYYRGAWSGLRRRMLHMDLPISLGIVAAFVFSTLATFQNRGEVYFDSVTGLITLLLAGRLVLQRAGRWAADAGESLLSLTPRSVKRVEDGAVREVLLTEVRAGDRLRVLPGETVPVDGVLESASAAVQEAHWTGEAAAVPRRRGETLYAGSTVVQAALEMTATAVGETTRLARLAEMMRHAAARRAPIVGVMDRIAGWFVGAVLGLALVTVGVWLVIDPARALWNAAAMMVVACPCALGLATPVALAMAMGRNARQGIFIKGQDGVERLASVDHVILDKTGTLTEGILTLVEQHFVSTFDEETARAILADVAALERSSGHVIATAFDGNAAETGRVEDCRTLPGAGIEGIIAGRAYKVGSETLAAACADLSPELRRHAANVVLRGLTPVWVVREGVAVAVLALGDRLRRDAGSILRQLRALGLTVELLSGDHPQAVEPIARELGIESWRGRVSPEDKLARVEALLAEGKRIAMVGDGVNDAAALSRATVGISAAGAAEVARDAADVFIATGRGPAAVADAFGLSRRALRVIRWNLGIALAYNVIGVSLAITGHVGPLVAAVLMPLSSLTVLLIASRA